MTNQTTDEAAVDIVEDLRVIARASAASVHVCQRVEDAADEIETLRAQLTAATRRAELVKGQYKLHVQWSADTIGKLEEREEQAERILAEAQRYAASVLADLSDAKQEIITLQDAVVTYGDRVRMANAHNTQTQQAIDRAFDRGC